MYFPINIVSTNLAFSGNISKTTNWSCNVFFFFFINLAKHLKSEEYIHHKVKNKNHKLQTDETKENYVNKNRRKKFIKWKYISQF